MKGKKILNLLTLINSNFFGIVPKFHWVTHDEILNRKAVINGLGLDKNILYAVRSAGNISTPGRMNSMLNVKFNNLSAAVKKVHDSSKFKRTLDYLEVIDYPLEDFTCDVMIMEMINCKFGYSGIVSNINPLTGQSEVYGKLAKDKFGIELMNGETEGQDILPKFKNELSAILESACKILNIKSIELEIAIDINGIIWVLQAREIKLTPVDQLGIHWTQPDLIGTPANSLSCQGHITWNINNHSNDSIYCTRDTTFEDIKLLVKHSGILVDRGGSMAHAAQISRSLNISLLGNVVDMNRLEEGTKIFFNRRGGIWILNN